ncbi:hypothetical protein T459_23192 [Capsicum annuum]|uniref:Uncharacterized protein n=1 Tax=Capsicum annuum TaxID=4072 RepID=A0A2G2YRM4_CAPAN|nr:hypothetical protein FXO37_26813 [Capsicum annuum]PHT72407.1 hypothetical protein T459_23192 [Capsicum annuum]
MEFSQLMAISGESKENFEPFLHEGLEDFSSAVFKKYGVKLAHILPEAASSNKTVDIQDLLLKASLGSIFRVAFRVELDNI